MNEKDKKELADMFNGLVTSLRKDLEKESKSNTSKLTSLHESIEEHIETGKRSNMLGLKPDYFSGSTDEDASQWLDFYEHIALINNWTDQLQLQAFPL